MLLILLDLTLRQIQQEIEVMIQSMMHLMIATTATLCYSVVSSTDKTITTKSICIVSIIIPSFRRHADLHPLIQLIVQLLLLIMLILLVCKILLIIHLQKCSCLQTPECSQNHTSGLLLLLKLLPTIIILFELLLIRWRRSFDSFMHVRLVSYVMTTTAFI